MNRNIHGEYSGIFQNAISANSEFVALLNGHL